MRKDYSSVLLEHYNNPQNVGELDETDKNVGTGKSGTASCGDVLRLQILVKNGIIEDVKFKTFGCGSAIASSSLLTQLVKGKKLEEVKNIKNSDIAEALSLPRIKLHCSVLAEEALSSAISDYWGKNGYEKVEKSVPLEENKVNNIKKDSTMTDESLLKLTQVAKDRMIDMVKAQNAKCVLISVKPGGCKGLKYNIEVHQDIPPGDTVIDGDLKVVIPAGALPLIKGSTIDYFDSGMRAGFKFDNPNQTGCCGCGMSFCA